MLLSFCKSEPPNLRWINLGQDSSSPSVFYKDRLMIEYLIETKGMTYKEVMQNSIEEDTVYSEMLDWYKGQAEQIAEGGGV